MPNQVIARGSARPWEERFSVGPPEEGVEPGVAVAAPHRPQEEY